MQTSAASHSQDMPRIGKVVKAIACLEGIISIIAAIVMVSTTDIKYDLCDSVRMFDGLWKPCLDNAEAAAMVTRRMGLAWGVGGIMAAVVIYCIGHIACVTDENNRLLRNIDEKK